MITDLGLVTVADLMEFPLEIKVGKEGKVTTVRGAQRMKVKGTLLSFKVEAVDCFHTIEPGNIVGITRNFGVIFRIAPRCGLAVIVTPNFEYAMLLDLGSIKHGYCREGLHKTVQRWKDLKIIKRVWRKDRDDDIWSVVTDWNITILKENSDGSNQAVDGREGQHSSGISA